MNPSKLAQKSNDILFKKLQREIEMAIRRSDSQMIGALEFQEVEKCFFTLDYLPQLNESKLMKRVNQPKNSSNAVQL